VLLSDHVDLHVKECHVVQIIARLTMTTPSTGAFATGGALVPATTYSTSQALSALFHGRSLLFKLLLLRPFPYIGSVLTAAVPVPVVVVASMQGWSI
jgi:hypothetical protein